MPNAILSVYDKTGLVDFAHSLKVLGWRLIASGGTARALRAASIPVTEVADYTNSPEILGGRVKTLHPAIHGGLLARATQDDYQELLRQGWDHIDLAAVNLYPFEAIIARPDTSLEEAIENIDIGGAALMRAAAKNYQRVALVSDPKDYPNVLAELRTGNVSESTRRTLAVKGFSQTTHYDAAITSYLSEQSKAALTLNLHPISDLRYGENPHQSATLYAYEPGSGPLGGQLLQGKALSYNNLLDLDAAWRAAVSFERPTVCIVKHLSPCGLASADTLALAFPGALASDPVSAFGGVVAVNIPFDVEIAQALGDLFVECIAAPGFSPDALESLKTRVNLRLVTMPDTSIAPLFELRSINQGILRQSSDQGDKDESKWQVVTDRQPSQEEWRSLRFAWKACQHVKSNAIVFASGEKTLGIGGGQPNRVDCVRIAAERAGERSRGAVMASDAFFPFPDSVEQAASAGISAIIAPGGSVRDSDSISAANENDIAMVFTGKRHFRH